MNKLSVNQLRAKTPTHTHSECFSTCSPIYANTLTYTMKEGFQAAEERHVYAHRYTHSEALTAGCSCYTGGKEGNRLRCRRTRGTKSTRKREKREDVVRSLILRCGVS